MPGTALSAVWDCRVHFTDRCLNPNYLLQVRMCLPVANNRSVQLTVKTASLHAYLGSRGSHRKVELGEETRQRLDLREQQPPVRLRGHPHPACKHPHSWHQVDALHMTLVAHGIITWQLGSQTKTVLS
jgi:hypothetical protein